MPCHRILKKGGEVNPALSQQQNIRLQSFSWWINYFPIFRFQGKQRIRCGKTAVRNDCSRAHCLLSTFLLFRVRSQNVIYKETSVLIGVFSSPSTFRVVYCKDARRRRWVRTYLYTYINIYFTSLFSFVESRSSYLDFGHDREWGLLLERQVKDEEEGKV